MIYSKMVEEATSVGLNHNNTTNPLQVGGGFKDNHLVAFRPERKSYRETADAAPNDDDCKSHTLDGKQSRIS